MVDVGIHDAGIVLALVGATGAGVLGLLARRLFSTSPFDRSLALLAAALLGVVAYHAGAFFLAPQSSALEVTESLTYTALAAFAWTLLRTHRRIHRAGRG